PAWRDHQQLAAVDKGDLSPFFAIVDFTKLAGGADDDLRGQPHGIPTTGFMSLLFASHFETNQGRRINSDPDGPRPFSFSQQNGFSQGAPGDNKRPGLAFGWPCREGCTPDLAGQLQRYLVYVPKVAPPSSGYGTMLWLTFPDVFGKAFICDGLDIAPSFPTVNGVADKTPVDNLIVHEPGSVIHDLLPSRRNQPVMEWAGSTDDFIPYNITRTRADLYAAGDYDYEFVTWHGLAAEHLTMCNNGTWDVVT